MLSNDVLTTLVQNISLASFNRPFEHRAMWNKRLKTTGGRYHLQTHHLDFNPKIMEKYDKAMLVAIIKHELCHYHLHRQGKGYQHKDHAFKNLLKQVGGIRYAPPLVDNSNWYEYVCMSCQTVIKRKRKVNASRYVCGKCHGKLRLKN